MLFRYCIRFKKLNRYHTRYIKARNRKQAITKLLGCYGVDEITSFVFLGDPLPCRVENVLGHYKRLKGMNKYEKLTGYNVFNKPYKS